MESTLVSAVFSLDLDFLIQVQKSKPKKTTERQIDGGFEEEECLPVGDRMRPSVHMFRVRFFLPDDEILLNNL